MSNIDERVVEMRFDNASFEKGISTSTKSLAELDKSVNNAEATKGMGKIGDAAVDTGSKFSAMSVIGITALATLANKAVTVGLEIAKSLTVSPIADGWSDYNTKLTSVQTIMNATGKSIEEVSGYFDQLDEYADKTIYNLSDMTGAFAKFTNAGISMDKSVVAIKGISNAVALAGQDAGAASIAYYNLSQSIAGGFLTTTDYKSLNLANVATKELKDYIVETAVAAGTLKKVGKGTYDIIAEEGKDAYKVAELFNGKLSEGWATSKVLLKTFGDFGNPLTDVGRKALAAAQDVKSLPMMIETLKAAVGTSWTESFEIILGDVTESKKLFTGLTVSISEILSVFNDARNALLTGWDKGGGPEDLAAGFQNLMDAILSVMKPIQKAWEAIFPNKKAVGLLVGLTEAFRKFTEKLILTDDRMALLKRTFKGIFAVVNIVFTVIKVVGKAVMAFIRPLINALDLGGDGILGLTAKFGDWAVSMDKAFQKSKFVKQSAEWLAAAGKLVAKYIGIARDKVVEFFEGLRNTSPMDTLSGGLSKAAEMGFKLRGMFMNLKSWLAPVSKAFSLFVKNLGSFTDGITSALGGIGGAVTSSNPLDGITEKMEKLKTVGANVAEGFRKFGDFLSKVWSGITNIGSGIKSMFTSIGDMFNNTDDNLKAGTLNLGLFVTGILLIKNILNSLGFDGFIKIQKAFADMMKGFTGTLNAFSTNLKAEALKTAALAVLFLAGAMWIMAQIPQEDMAGIAVTMVALMYALNKMVQGMAAFTKEGTALKMIQVAASMVIMAGALILIALAAKIFATVPWGGLAKGGVALVAIAGVMIGIGYAMKALNTVELIKFSTAMLILAVAMTALAGAIKIFQMMKMETIVDGMLKIGFVLIILSAAFHLLPKEGELIKGAVAIGIMAGSLTVMAAALQAFIALDPDRIGDAMVTMGVSLALVVLALNAIPVDAAKRAAGIAIVAGAILLISEALTILGQLSIGQLVAGIAAMGIALLVIVGIGYLAEGAAVGLLALGVSIFLMGAGVFLAANGLLAFARALEQLFETFSRTPGEINKILVNLGTALPKFFAILALSLVTFIATFLDQLVKMLPPILTALISILMAVLDALREVLPVLVQFLLDFLTMLIEKLLVFFIDIVPKLAAAGTDMFIALIDGFTRDMPLIIEAVTEMIVAFLDGLTDSLPEIIDAGADLIVALIEGFGEAQMDIIDAAVAVVVGFLEGLADNSTDIIDAGGDLIITLLEGLGQKTTEIADAAMDFIDDLIDALVGDGDDDGLIDAGTDLILAVIHGLAENTIDVVTGIGEAMIMILNGMTNWINNHGQELNNAGKELATAIIEGLVLGLSSPGSALWDAAWNLGTRVINGAKAALDSNSPSKAFIQIGKDVNKGFLIGLESGSRDDINKAWDSMKKEISDFVKDSNESIKKHQATLKELYKDRTKNAKAIEKEEKALAKATKERDKATKAYARMNKDLKDERDKLKKLADQYQKVVDKLDKAKDKLADAKATRDDYKADVKDNFNDFMDIDENTTLEDTLDEDGKVVKGFFSTMQEQLDQTQKFRDRLQTLQSMGLNDNLYKQFVDQGLDSLPFIDQLIAGGDEAIDKANQIDSDMNTIAAGLGKDTSTALYQAGVDAAQGLVDGLKKQEANLEAQMEKLASVITNAIKKALGIKSPSKVLTEIGKYTGAGLVKGLEKSNKAVEVASTDLADTSVTALTNTMKRLGEVVPEKMNLEPTVTPVLDLDAMKKKALGLDSMFAPRNLAMTTSVSGASSVADSQRVLDKKAAEDAYLKARGGVTFIQNNNSPKALSESEIYRQTSNVISKAKGALTT